MKAAFELVTRQGCHLCVEMEELLDEVLPSLSMSYTKRDVDDDPGLRVRFGDVVPVLLREGLPVAKVRLSRQQLLRIIRRRLT